jgi:UDP-glucuronate decarboxylase
MRLLKRGDQVICLDNLQTGRLENLQNESNNSNLTFVHHDVIQPYHFEVDEIYNLACAASPPAYQLNPAHTLQTCTIGTLNGLNAAYRANAKFLQASTSEVYGDPIQHPQTESYWGNVNPFGPRSCYDEGKRASEAFCFAYKSKVNLRVARIFNTYGPFMHVDDGRVISNLVTRALLGRDLTIYGDGQQTRSFCFIDDLINGLMLLMDHQNDMSYPVNLGNPDERTVSEVAELIRSMTGSRSAIVSLPLPTDDPSRRKPDISEANRTLGWNPDTSLEDGIFSTIQYFSGIIQSANLLRRSLS